ncbi:MAG: J domain-containing protein [Sphingomonadaceae bacterium]|nr:J domain-containing protein [Thermaurantiacus sp.]MCS6986085.1 J domain-containing protein [Sphingomonadaceae bacterium]
MMDPYATLGVARTASADEIKRAYRRLAKELHPDRTKGDANAAERFKAITQAYDLLSDPEKRAKFDRGEIDAQGNPTVPPGFEGFRTRPGAGPFGNGGRGRAGFDGFEADFGSILDELFAAAGGGRARARPQRKGADAVYHLSVPFAEAALARPQRLALRSGRIVDVKLPPGIEDGQQLRLAGQGEPGPAGPGDAIVTVHIQPDPRFTREGDDIRTELMVPLVTAVLGGEVRAPTPDGEVLLKIAPGTTSGRLLRLKGRGFTRRSGGRGDLLARVLVDVPASDPALADFLRGRLGRGAAA